MLSCDKFASLITDYLDGHLSPEKRVTFEEHLFACRNCSLTFQRVKILKARLRQLTPVQTSPAFEIVLRSRLRRELDSLTFWDRILEYFPWGGRIPAFAFSLLLLFLLSYVVVDLLKPLASSSEYAGSTAVQTSSYNLTEFQGPLSPGNGKASVVEERVTYIIEDVSAEWVSKSGFVQTVQSAESWSNFSRDSLYGYPSAPLKGEAMTMITF